MARGCPRPRIPPRGGGVMTSLFVVCPRCDGRGEVGHSSLAPGLCGECQGLKFVPADLTTDDVSMLRGAVERLGGQLADAERERDRLVAGCVVETWRRPRRTMGNAEDDLDDEHGWEWRFGATG